MFDIGFAEILFVAVVALVVLGPEKLPAAIKSIALWVGKIRRTLSSIQSEINEELRIDELKRSVAIEKEQLEKELDEMRQPFSSALDEQDSPMASKVASPEELQNAEAEQQESPEIKPDTKNKDEREQ